MLGGDDKIADLRDPRSYRIDLDASKHARNLNIGVAPGSIANRRSRRQVDRSELQPIPGDISPLNGEREGYHSRAARPRWLQARVTLDAADPYREDGAALHGHGRGELHADADDVVFRVRTLLNDETGDPWPARDSHRGGVHRTGMCREGKPRLELLEGRVPSAPAAQRPRAAERARNATAKHARDEAGTPEKHQKSRGDSHGGHPAG